MAAETFDVRTFDLVTDEAATWQRLWWGYDRLLDDYEVIPELLQKAADFTGQIVEIDPDDEIETLDATLCFFARSSISLLIGSYPDFADDDDEAALKFIDSIDREDFEKTSLVGHQREKLIQDFAYDLGVFSLYHAFHLEALVDAHKRFRELTADQIERYRIDPAELKKWFEYFGTMTSGNHREAIRLGKLIVDL